MGSQPDYHAWFANLQRCAMIQRRRYTAALLFALNAIWLQVPVQAQNLCAIDFSNNYFWNAETEIPVPNNCQGATGFRCLRAEATGVLVKKSVASCDPNAGPCAVEVHAYFKAEGVRSMIIEDGGGIPNGSIPTPWAYWYPCAGADCTETIVCGVAGLGGQINFDNVDTWAQLSLSCAQALSTNLSVKARICPVGCQKNTVIELPSVELARQLGCVVPPPRKHDCECETSRTVGSGCAGLDGEPASAAPPGHPAFVRYSARGAGFSGMPGWQEWRKTLGLGWSHEYAMRIVEDPVVHNETDVWLITPTATFRRFYDLEAGGGLRRYQATSPSDEKRSLYFNTATQSYALHELDGTIHLFDAAGRWLSTTDRNGHGDQGSYNGSGQLTLVTMADGRRDAFTYDGSGKLASIAQMGAGVTDCVANPQGCRTWTYSWSGDSLRQIGRPDNTAWLFAYEDGRVPGFMTRMYLKGTDGNIRLETAWQYDSSGRVVDIWRGTTNENANFPPSPNASSVDRWSFAYTELDAQGRPTQVDVTDPLRGTPAIVSLGYDTVSNKPRLNSISGDCPTCWLGPNSQLTYDDLSANPLLPISVTNGRGVRTDFAYDTNGMMTLQIDGANDPFDDPNLTRSTVWEYDPGYPALVTSIEGPFTGAVGSRITTFTRGPTGDIDTKTIEGIEATRPGGTFSLPTQYTYVAGLPQTIDPPGYGTADQTSFTYAVPNTNGMLADSRTDPLVGATNFAYDLFNRRTRVTDPNDVATDTEYDALGRVTRVIQRGDDDLSEADDLITVNFYNPVGDLYCVKLPRGNGLEYVYEFIPARTSRLLEVRRGTVVASPNGSSCLEVSTGTPAERTIYTLDQSGNRTSEKRYRSSGAGWQGVADYEATYTYTTRCRLDKVTLGSGAAAAVTEYAYDCAGNLDRLWDALHPRPSYPGQPSTSYEYDALDRLISASQPWGGAGGGDVVTTYAYDDQDHLISVDDAEHNVTSYIYSDRDLLTEQVSPVSGTTAHSYNDHGAQISSTDARNVTVDREVDELDRVTSIDYPAPDDALDTSFTYDGLETDFLKGRLAAIDRGNGASLIEYAYDRFGRMLQDGLLSYEYDANGNRSEIGYGDGTTACYTFDFGDRQATLAFSTTGGATPCESGTSPLVSASSYYAQGPLGTAVLGNGVTETRTFDQRYVPDRITAATGAPPLLDWDYSTDKLGNPTLLADLVASPDRTYGYQDFQYFLTSAVGPWANSPGQAWTYDKIGNRLSEADSTTPATLTYGYTSNGSGNTPKLATITPAPGNSATGQWAFAFDAAGNQTSITASGGELFGTDVFGYSAESKLASLGTDYGNASTTLLYDGRGFLRQSLLTYPNGDLLKAEPRYSSTGLLLQRKGERSRSFAHPDSGIINTTGSFTKTTDIFYFAGRPIALRTKYEPDGIPGLLYLTTDHLGTPVLSTTTGGEKYWLGGFEPFGEAYTFFGDSEMFLRFPGQWDDASWHTSGRVADMYYNVNRWLDSATGRYSAPDPLGLQAGSRNGINLLYVYAAGRPTFLIDLLGLAVQTRNCDQGFADAIQRAVDKAKDILKDPKDPCELCDNDTKRMLDHLDNATYYCSSEDPSALARTYNLPPNACGGTRNDQGQEDKKSITLVFPRVQNDLICGCIEGSILHEASHNVLNKGDMLGYDSAYDFTRKCTPCSR